VPTSTTAQLPPLPPAGPADRLPLLSILPRSAARLPALNTPKSARLPALNAPQSGKGGHPDACVPCDADEHLLQGRVADAPVHQLQLVPA
jgi:hypothetical protein